MSYFYNAVYYNPFITHCTQTRTGSRIRDDQNLKGLDSFLTPAVKHYVIVSFFIGLCGPTPPPAMAPCPMAFLTSNVYSEVPQTFLLFSFSFSAHLLCFSDIYFFLFNPLFYHLITFFFPQESKTLKE